MLSKLWLAAAFAFLIVPHGSSSPLLSVHTREDGLKKRSNPPLQYITLEEHYDPSATWAYQKEDGVYDLYEDFAGPYVKEFIATLRNISVRIPEMDANGIKMQVVAADPNPYALTKPQAVRRANDELAKVISQYPDRFRAFCFLPMSYPDLAAKELKRCVGELGFLGALVDGHLLNNTFYDGTEYDVLWDAFVELDVPMYMHPTYPPISQVNGTDGLYTPEHSVYSQSVAAALGVAGWGWHSDNGLAFVRMWLGGVFDRHPQLKIVLGHMGEMVPYMLHRVEYVLATAKPDGVNIYEAYAKNIWITTSGFFSLVPFKTLQAATASDRIMYSVDYPWGEISNGTTFMESLKDSGLVTECEWEAIAFGNAEKLLKL